MTCLAEPSSQKEQNAKENAMIIYPKIYVDYRQSSCQSQTSNAEGKKLWFTPNTDTENRNPPTLILVTEEGLAVQYNNRFEHIGFDGKIAWTEEREPGMNIIAFNKNIYYRSSNYNLYGVDMLGKNILYDFFVPTSSERGFFHLVMPIGEDHFLIQTFNYAPEADEDSPDIKDDNNLVLMGSESWDDWDWHLEFEGTVLPALVSGDSKKIILLNTNNQVKVFDIETGKQSKVFEIEGVAFHLASLDNDDNIIISVNTVENQRKLLNYTLDGDLNWEYELPFVESMPFAQPPAIDSNNRVYFIINNFLYVINKGKLQWQYPLPEAQYYQFITILGDNSVLVVAANLICHLAQNGDVIFTSFVMTDDQITTPPVIDLNGRIYFGAAAGVYCYK